MTSAERLIKTACDLRLKAIELEPKKAMPTEVAWKDLPAPARAAVHVLMHCAEMETKAKRTLRQLGFSDHVYPQTRQPDKLSVASKKSEAFNEAQRVKLNVRRHACWALRNAAAIAVMGLSNQAAAPLVRKLEADLAKV